MITIKEWMELVNYRITEGGEFGWDCYGPNTYFLDSFNTLKEYNLSIIFDTQNQTVYEVQAHDYKNNRAYRMINPESDYVSKYKKEAKRRRVSHSTAYDEVEYMDLEVDDDFIQKALAIVAGKDYDTRIEVPVDFTDEELLRYMKAAHDRDMTFNQFVEEALKQALEEYERDPEGMTARAKEWMKRNDPT